MFSDEIIDAAKNVVNRYNNRIEYQKRKGIPTENLSPKINLNEFLSTANNVRELSAQAKALEKTSVVLGNEINPALAYKYENEKFRDTQVKNKEKAYLESQPFYVKGEKQITNVGQNLQRDEFLRLQEDKKTYKDFKNNESLLKRTNTLSSRLNDKNRVLGRYKEERQSWNLAMQNKNPNIAKLVENKLQNLTDAEFHTLITSDYTTGFDFIYDTSGEELSDDNLYGDMITVKEESILQGLDAFLDRY